jgi:hypothetical protein
MMKKILLITLLIFTACQNKNSQGQPNRKIEKEFYENEKSEYKITYHKNGYDSVIYKYRNGEIYKTGKLRNKNKYGNWFIYDSLKDLRQIREFVIVNNSTYLNRVFHLKNGDTLAKKYDLITAQQEFAGDTLNFNNTTYNFIKVLSSDTISINEPFAAYALSGSPTMRNLNSQVIVLVGKEKNNFNSDFSNLKEVKLDTFYNANIDTINQKNFPGYNWNYVVAFGKYFGTSGKKTIKGYILEYAESPFKDSLLINQNIDSLTTKTYFEKVIFVRENRQ